MSEPLLRLTDIYFGYPGHHATLKGATLSLESGQTLALGGNNGAGKTTLLHVAVGLLRPSGGSIELFGRHCESEADFAEVRPSAGLVFQNTDDQLFCPTVIEDVAFGPLNLGQSQNEARAAAEEALARVGLPGFDDRITHKLSGGEKRLVALATVLAMAPKLLLLDEPTAGLDRAARDRVVRLLADLPIPKILIAHDAELCRTLATDFVRLEDGRIEPAA